MDIITWYEQTVGSASVNSVAIRAGINQSTLNRQLHAQRLEPSIVVAIARAYDKDAIDALTIQGLLNEADLKRRSSRLSLRDAEDSQIVAEIERRLTDAADHTVFDKPL